MSAAAAWKPRRIGRKHAQSQSLNVVFHPLKHFINVGRARRFRVSEHQNSQRVHTEFAHQQVNFGKSGRVNPAFNCTDISA